MSAPKQLPLTTVRLRVDVRLPKRCIACGEKTSKTIVITRSRSEGGESWLVKVLVFLWSPVVFLFARKQLTGKQQEVSLPVPFCGSCAFGDKEPRPTHVNFERQELEFIVHDDFAKAFRDA
jgi:hypothetical protein